MDRGVAAAVRTAIEDGGERFWRPLDFAALPPRAVDRALCRQAAQGELRHVRRGLYWRGVKGAFGMSRPSLAQIVAVIAGEEGVGPAGVSAANALGLTSQMSPVELVAVPVRAPEPLGQIKFVDRVSRRARVVARLNTTEVAVLEVLADWSDLVEVDLSIAERRLATLFEKGAVRAKVLARGAANEPSEVRERLRHFLGATGHGDAIGLVPPARTPALRRRALEALHA